MFFTSGPGRRTESVSVDYIFDADTAVLAWESLLTGVTLEELRHRGEPRIVRARQCGDEEFALSSALRTALAEADHERLQRLAHQWADLEARDGYHDPVTAEEARELLTGLAALAREAGKSHNIHCRWG
ncbi:hypothetical protein FB465_7111 [Kitasatospora atroaurantiaca]|uniref:Uncharacterized protein n=2 Tax=Kitasatospora atroaurantiaca TaxID=285545 RepID=A0A561F1Y8_9ACTN|nr:hypothetical protein FB465_7111 [Kitasatospora atroaurantiaca]